MDSAPIRCLKCAAVQHSRDRRILISYMMQPLDVFRLGTTLQNIEISSQKQSECACEIDIQSLSMLQILHRQFVSFPTANAGRPIVSQILNPQSGHCLGHLKEQYMQAIVLTSQK